MKLDIKSFLIGILTTVNLFLLMGFDDHEEDNQIGRYQFEIEQNKYSSQSYIMDTTNGQFVKYDNKDTVVKQVEDNRGQIKAGVKY